ncbi:MAG: hypothetical protein K0R31_2179 [Clostridiales bacterium]|jgi:uncharacterized protein with ParB-like and HNH nuclease domain|nr:hypothetical protein [Clostridiales bacterium]
MEFQAYPRTIQDILYLQKQYIVPRFQREYSWTNEHLNELWKDIISNIGVQDDKYVPKDISLDR